MSGDVSVSLVFAIKNAEYKSLCTSHPLIIFVRSDNLCLISSPVS